MVYGPAPHAPTDWLTADEAVAHLRLSSRLALYKRVERGQIPAHRWGRQLRFRRGELDALIDAPIPWEAVSAVAGQENRRW